MSVVTEKNFRVLIASENLNFRNNLATKLRGENYVVDLATGGFHLLHLLEQEKEFSLIIIHENMHDMPGFEAISIIRVNKSKQELPILYISKNDSEDEVCEMVFTGANEYVVQSTSFLPIIERAKKYFKQFHQNAA